MHTECHDAKHDFCICIIIPLILSIPTQFYAYCQAGTVSHPVQAAETFSYMIF